MDSEIKIDDHYIINNMSNIFIKYSYYLLKDKKVRCNYENNIVKLLEKNDNILLKFKDLLKNNNNSIDQIINQLVLLLLYSNSDDMSKLLINMNLVNITLSEYDFFKNKVSDFKNDLKKYENTLNNKRNEYDTIDKYINNKLPSISIENKCVICYINIKTHIIYPCGHKCICQECEKKKKMILKCPICNHKIIDIIKIFE